MKYDCELIQDLLSLYEEDLCSAASRKAVEELCRRPDMAQAIAAITPEGLSPNKQMVANFVKGGHFFILTQMYRLKNRI